MLKSKKPQPVTYKLILRKSYKILGLSFAILILALIFFFERGKNLFSEVKPIQNQKTNSQFRVEPLSPGFSLYNLNLSFNNDFPKISLPSVDKFFTFVYNDSGPLGQKKLNLQIKCQDAYYVILIFNIQDDYRENPGAARFNRAFPCQKGEVVNPTINLEELNLTSGKYYFIIADQGETGSWYNPR